MTGIEFTQDGKHITSRSWAALRRHQRLNLRQISDITGVSYDTVSGLKSSPPQWLAVVMVLLRSADEATLAQLIDLRRRVERWRKIKSFPFYEVSNLGQVRRIGASKLRLPGHSLVQRVDRAGYLRVTLYTADGTMKTQSVHRLVAQTFLRKRKGKDVACHINGIQGDCRAENLYWGTAKSNGMDRVRHRQEKIDKIARRKTGRPRKTGTIWAHSRRTQFSDAHNIVGISK